MVFIGIEPAREHVPLFTATCKVGRHSVWMRKKPTFGCLWFRFFDGRSGNGSIRFAKRSEELLPCNGFAVFAKEVNIGEDLNVFGNIARFKQNGNSSLMFAGGVMQKRKQAFKRCPFACYPGGRHHEDGIFAFLARIAHVVT
ncbi:MAG TPA: hypothetical protein VFQ13_17195 [Anaerolineales bacterium]|nr:hypothetical protein [Anaerolineales bacterium]